MERKGQIRLNKKLLIIGLVALAIATTAFLLPKNDNNKQTTPVEKQEETKEPCDSCTIKDVVSMNAYEYIMEVMSAPQYWGVDNLPLYNLDYEQEYSYEVLKKQNGTGWILKDLDSATFYRGSEGALTIDFSNFSANIETWADVYSSNESGTLDNDATRYEFDYNNEIYKYTAPYGNSEANHNYDYEIELSSKTIKPLTEQEFRESNDLFDERFTVKDIILYYDSLFKEAGCPLLNMPKGTLESYKNKTVNVPVKENDNLIHAIWQQDNFRWDWDKAEDTVWLDSYKDIFNQQFPENTFIDIVEINGQSKSLANNSSLFLMLADKDNCTFQYQDRNPYSATLMLKLDEYFGAEAGGFATYFLKPMTELMYGYNGVYFCDTKNLPSSGTLDLTFKTKEQFLKNFGYSKEANSSTILTMHNEGDYAVSLVGYEGDECQSFYTQMFMRLKQVAKYYGKEFPFADDYMFNFYIFYNPSAQRLLGLR